MRKYTAFVLMVSLPILFLASCDGGGGNGEGEFNVYDVTINIETVEGFDTDCPDNANLKLSLLIDESNISGFAELLRFGNISDPVDVSGLKEDSSFSLEPFFISVGAEGFPFAGTLQLGFFTFEGTIITNEEDTPTSEINGIDSGRIFFGETDAITCEAEFTGEFSGIARSPEGCVSRMEVPTLECPAEGFVNQCDQYDTYFCPGYCEPPEEGGLCADFLFNASECAIIDCVTLSCPQVGIIHLEEQGGFMFVIGDHILHCG